MSEKAGRRPVVVTVHDLMPVVVLRSPTDGWREGVRNRFLRQALKALRQADSYIVGTDWLKRELATWLGDERNIHVVPFGVDRAFFGESAVPRGPGRRARGVPRPPVAPVAHRRPGGPQQQSPPSSAAAAARRARADWRRPRRNSSPSR